MQITERLPQSVHIWRTCSKRSETRIPTYNWQLRPEIRWYVVLKVKNFWKTLYLTMTKWLLKHKITSKIQKHNWKICQIEKNTTALKKPSKTMNQKWNISCNKKSSKSSIIWKYKGNSTTEEKPQPTKHKTGFQKTYASVEQGTDNTHSNVSITHKSNNKNAGNEYQTILNKLKTLNTNKQLRKARKMII